MFLANENFPAPSIAILREAGYMVASIREESPGIRDEEVIVIALNRNLIILTFDKDYGEIIFRQGLAIAPSVVFFRAKGINPQWGGERLSDLLAAGKTFDHCFTIIEQNGVRQRMYE